MTKCRFCDTRVSVNSQSCPSCGAPVEQSGDSVPTDIVDEVMQLLSAGKKIDAIARYREATGTTLADAKEAVEALGQRQQASPSDLDAGLLEEVLSLMGSGKKIEAVKRYRAQMGVGLAEAKQAVEALAAQHGVAGQGSGCATVLAAVAVVVGGCVTLVMTLITNGW